MNRIYRGLQYGAYSTWLLSEFAGCLKARGDQAGSKVGKLVYGVKRGLILTGCVLLPPLGQLKMVATRLGATVWGSESLRGRAKHS